MSMIGRDLYSGGIDEGESRCLPKDAEAQRWLSRAVASYRRFEEPLDVRCYVGAYRDEGLKRLHCLFQDPLNNVLDYRIGLSGRRGFSRADPEVRDMGEGLRLIGALLDLTGQRAVLDPGEAAPRPWRHPSFSLPYHLIDDADARRPLPQGLPGMPGDASAWVMEQVRIVLGDAAPAPLDCRITATCVSGRGRFRADIGQAAGLRYAIDFSIEGATVLNGASVTVRDDMVMYHLLSHLLPAIRSTATFR